MLKCHANTLGWPLAGDQYLYFLLNILHHQLITTGVAMEHRCSTERHQCNIKILIYKNKTPVAFGRIKNGSASGLFIETDLKSIQPGQLLTLDMMLNKMEKRSSVRLVFVR
jgi:hypothetical protein